MSLTEIRGDLFAVPGLDALAHGVNCRGVMGAGIALQFKRRWPAMFRAYGVRSQYMRPGDLFDWHDPVTHRWIYNLATQASPGPCATLDAVRLSVGRMVEHAVTRHVRRIGMPRVGCGIGGLSWEDVQPIVAQAAQRVDIVVVEWAKSAAPMKGATI